MKTRVCRGLSCFVLIFLVACSAEHDDLSEDAWGSGYHVVETLNCGDGKHWIIRVVGDYENVYYKPDHRLVLSESPELPKGPLVVLGEVDRLAGLDILSSREGVVVVRITSLLTTDVPCPKTYQSASVRIEFTDD